MIFCTLQAKESYYCFGVGVCCFGAKENQQLLFSSVSPGDHCF